MAVSVPRISDLVVSFALGLAAALGILVFSRVASPIGAVDVPTRAPVLAFGVITGVTLAAPRLLARARTILGWAAALSSAAVAVAGAMRAGTVPRERLPRTAPIAGELVADGTPLTVGALSFHLFTEQSSAECRLWITKDRDVSVVGYPPVGAPAPVCQAVRVRYDAADEVAILQLLPLWNAPFAGDDAWQILDVRSTRDGASLPLTARTLRGMYRVPATWAAGAATGTVLALALLAMARRLRRRAETIGALSDAEHEGDGWFALEGGRRVRVPSATALAAGPFVVRIAEDAPASTYREAASSSILPLARGTTGAAATRARALAGCFDAFALAAAVLGSAPVAAALAVVA